MQLPAVIQPQGQRQAPQRGGRSKRAVKATGKLLQEEVSPLKKHKIKILPWTISLLFKEESSPEKAKISVGKLE